MPGKTSCQDPAFATAVCRYDLGAGSLKLSAPVSQAYTSVTFYTRKSVAYYAINDRAAGRRSIELYLMTPEQHAEVPEEEDVTAADFAREKEIFLAQAVASGKPPNIAEKMVAGKMEKFYEEVCLLEQPFIKDQTVSISQLIAAKIGKVCHTRHRKFSEESLPETFAFQVEKCRRGKEQPSNAIDCQQASRLHSEGISHTVSRDHLFTSNPLSRVIFAFGVRL